MPGRNDAAAVIESLVYSATPTTDGLRGAYIGMLRDLVCDAGWNADGRRARRDHRDATVERLRRQRDGLQDENLRLRATLTEVCGTDDHLIQIARRNGTAPITQRRTRRGAPGYPPSFRAEVVAYALEHSAADAAARYPVHLTTVRRWLREHRVREVHPAGIEPAASSV